MPVDNTKQLKRVNGVIVPQYWNEDIQDWEIVQGSGGAYKMQSSVDVSEEPFSGSGNLTKEFTKEMNGLVISNDGASDLTFTIDGQTRTVKAGEVYEGKFKPFTTVTINSAVAWRAEGIQTIGGTSTVIVEPPDDTTAPDNVTNLTTSNLTATSLTLTWNASASNDCTGYDIYRGSTLLTTVTGTTYNVSGLTQATQYTFTVKAKDAVPNIASGTSTTVTTASSADTTPPANVTNLTTANITQSGLTLNWTASVSSDVASYDVYNGATFLANVTGVTYNVNGLAATTAYTFTVKAKDASGNAASGTSVEATTSAPAADTTAPNPVTALTAGTSTSSTVPLTWTLSSSGDVATQEVAYSTDGTNFTVASAVVNAASNTYTVTGLTAATAYTFRVVAVDAANNRSTAVTTTKTTAAAATGTGLTALKGINAVDYTKVGATAQTRKVTVPDAVMNEAAYTKVVYVYSGAINVTTGNFNMFSSSNAVMWIVDGVFTGGHGSAYTAFNTGVTVVQNTWYHVVQAFDGTTMKYYINGIERFSGAASVPSSQTDIEIGAYNGNFEWSAYIAGAWIYNRALTPTEITDHSTGTITTSGLLGEWKFEEGTGTTSADTSGNNNTATLGVGMLWKNVTTV